MRGILRIFGRCLTRMSSTLVAMLILSGFGLPAVGMAADCALAPSNEDYLGVRYRAFLAEDELSETDWVILFGGSGFTTHGEYQPHFIDLMIKGSWSLTYEDPACGKGNFPGLVSKEDVFGFEFGLSDYEDPPGYYCVQDNDIACWTRNPSLFPRMFSNIDDVDPKAADKITANYQVSVGGALEGHEIEVSFVREEKTRLPPRMNYFMDPDLDGAMLCKPNSQADIWYWHWVGTFSVPSLGINAAVDFYVNADQGEKINGHLYTHCLNFMWENPGRPAIESDKFKVILYDLEVMTETGAWKPATCFLVDVRSPDNHLPLDARGNLLGGFRRTTYEGRPAIEASFGYGYTDYVVDGNLNDREASDATRGVIDLTQPSGLCTVLFDEGHEVLWTNATANGLSQFVQLLQQQGCVVDVIGTAPLSDSELSRGDVLVVGWSSQSYSPNEVECVKAFVKNGGGLLVMGEGWSWSGPGLFPLNQIAGAFGFKINSDAVHEVSQISPHEVTNGVGTIKVAAASSIAGSAGTTLAYDPFGQSVLIAGTYGNGRFLFVGDSDIFVNLDYDNDGIPMILEGDNSVLGRNAIRWLAGGAK